MGSMACTDPSCCKCGGTEMLPWVSTVLLQPHDGRCPRVPCCDALLPDSQYCDLCGAMLLLTHNTTTFNLDR